MHMKQTPPAPWRGRPALLACGGAVLLHLLVLGPGAARSAPAQPLRVTPLQTRWVVASPQKAPLAGITADAVATPTLPSKAPAARKGAAPGRPAPVAVAAAADLPLTAQPMLPGAFPSATEAPPESKPEAEPEPPRGARESPLHSAGEAAQALMPPLLVAAVGTPAGAPQGVAVGTGDDSTPVPVYPTRVAPPLRLSYRLQRGMVSGTAVLDWQHDAAAQANGAYELRLDARAGPLTLLSQHSQGRFDAAGLAPLRFTDQRLRGGQKAANFQRQRGVVSFSGPAVEYPLVPGVQDRLSWMLQLPAIVSALPARALGTEPVVLQVIGARGDLAVWSFRLVGKEPVLTEGGVVPALKFLREPRKPNDTQVEVWLDPALHHLPVRARIGNPPDAEVFELIRLAR